MYVYLPASLPADSFTCRDLPCRRTLPSQVQLRIRNLHSSSIAPAILPGARCDLGGTRNFTRKLLLYTLGLAIAQLLAATTCLLHSVCLTFLRLLGLWIFLPFPHDEVFNCIAVYQFLIPHS